jgi:hypothetical protein
MLSISSVSISDFSSAVRATDERASHGKFIVYRLGVREFSGIFPEVMISSLKVIFRRIPRGEGPVINDILHRKLIKEPTKFRINYKIC